MPRNIAILLLTIFLFLIKNCFAQSEFFAKRIVNALPLGHPFGMVMGPDDSLWVTERRGYVKKLSALNGGSATLLDIHNKVRINATTVSQNGMMEMALHPELNKGTGNDYVYLAYC